MRYQRKLRWMIVCVCCLAALPLLTAHSASDSVSIHLRRATFEPLQQAPSLSSLPRTSASSTLRIVQLSSPPDSQTRAQLEAAGMHPLSYIPDNAFLVRMDAEQTPAFASLRWSGPFQPIYKIPSELDSLLTSTSVTSESLRLLAAPDADDLTVATTIQAAGGSVLGATTGLNGTTFRILLPSTALATLLQNDDVLWVEQTQELQLLNDKSRDITGVTTAQTQLDWLTGAGQIVAVADTGLDNQSSLSADFSGRVASAYGPNQLSSSCSTSNWSDRNGHGTHVSGSILGNGSLSSGTYAGMAPEANIVVAAISNSGSSLDCLEENTTFLSLAYNAGARIENASWGGATGSNGYNLTYGGYDSFAAMVDDYLWNHKDHLLVVAAGNQASDSNNNGVIDTDSINTPATAKNVLAVGASENDRQPSTSSCSISRPENQCWNMYVSTKSPISTDFVSDNPDGMAAFSSRGPTDDGRIKPEIVAPGTNIISARSHASGASYSYTYDSNYAYESGTSMATPIVSGAAALIRQWLSEDRSISDPSAALVKALLLNGATDLNPGQYGTGSQQEIPDSWPNNVEGWGRLNVADSVQLDDNQIWLQDNNTGLETGASQSYSFKVTSQQPLRVTLAWTDYPGVAFASKTLVNDLDLQVEAPDGTISYGNATSASASSCQTNNADHCNNVESVAIDAPQIGTYTLRVKGYSVTQGPQPFALVARLDAAASPPSTPTLATPSVDGSVISLGWTAQEDATSYQLQMSSDSTFDSPVSYTTDEASTKVVTGIGSYFFRVRACNDNGCSTYSNIVSATIATEPEKLRLPAISTME